MTKDEALVLALTALHTEGEHHPRVYEAMDAIQTVLAQPVQEPVAKVGDKVICLEDESLGEVVSLTAGGSPDIKFADGSHGTYLLREFAELFGNANPFATDSFAYWAWGGWQAAQRPWVGLTNEDWEQIHDKKDTALDTFQQGAVWATDQLRERNT